MSIFNRTTRHDFEREHEVDINSIFDSLEREYPLTLVGEQIALEHESYRVGEERFFRELEKNIENSRLATTSLMSVPLTGWWDATVREINRRRQLELDKKSSAYWMKWYTLTTDASSEVLANIVISILTNNLFIGSYHSAQTIWSQVGEAVEDQIRFARVRDAEGIEWNRRYSKEFDKRASDNNRYEYMKRVESEAISSGLVSVKPAWTTDECRLVGFELVECVERATGLFTVKQAPQYLLGKSKKKRDITVLELTPEWESRIHELAFYMSANNPVFYPTLIPPKNWTTFDDGGYWTRGKKKLTLIQSNWRKNIIKAQSEVPMPKVLEAINILQNTPWKINTKVYEVVKELFENDDRSEITSRINKWPSHSIPEFREYPEDGTEEEKKLWRLEKHKLYQDDTKRVSRRLSLTIALQQAEKFKDYDQFYMPYYCDFRGRVYAFPALNPQGGDVMKALLTPASGKPMGERGWFWLRAHCATTGQYNKLDKAPLEERVKWVDDNLPQIIATAMAPLQHVGFWTDSGNPFQFLAACMEVTDAYLSGDPESYESSFLVSFDGSCSGLQHYSAMLRDEVGGAKVNLIPSAVMSDVYGTVAEKVIDRLRFDAVMASDVGKVVVNEDGEEVYLPSIKSMAINWLQFGIDRSVCKRPVMTFCYSSREFGMKEQTLSDILNPARTEANENDAIFKYSSEHCWYLARAIYKATGQVVIKANECMDYLREVTDLLMQSSENGKPLEWITPDGFYVKQEYLKQECKQTIFKTLIKESANIRKRFKPAFMEDSHKIDQKQRNSVAPNFIHSLDATHLRMTVRNCYYRGVTSFGVIHDSFGTIPADAQIMFDEVRNTMPEMYSSSESDMLAQIDSYVRANVKPELLECVPAIPSKGNLDLDGIARSEFAFC